MKFDMEAMTAADRYELLLGTVVPRPIAIVTTVSHAGDVNAAPYSLFNVVCHDPPVMAISALLHSEGRFKDTAANIFATKEFVVNLVSEMMAEAMNTSCIDAPPNRNELELAGLASSASHAVKPPRIAGSPVAFECRLVQSLSFGPSQSVCFGQVFHAHVEDRHVIDAGKGLVDTPALKLFGAMHGARWYSRTADNFAMDRPTWANWVETGKVR